MVELIKCDICGNLVEEEEAFEHFAVCFMAKEQGEN